MNALQRAFKRLKEEIMANPKATSSSVRGRFWELLKEERRKPE